MYEEVNTIALACYRKDTRVKQENKLTILDRLNSPAKQFLFITLDCILNENVQGFDLCDTFHKHLLTNWLPCFTFLSTSWFTYSSTGQLNIRSKTDILKH